jgi:thioesterase domain-containing protein
VFGVAITLAACGTAPNPLHLLDTVAVMNPPPKAAELAMPAQPVSLATTADYVQQINDLYADNMQLKKELADALNETAKLKKQLNEEMQDNSLLRDLAARKMR